MSDDLTSFQDEISLLSQEEKVDSDTSKNCSNDLSFENLDDKIINNCLNDEDKLGDDEIIKFFFNFTRRK